MPRKKKETESVTKSRSSSNLSNFEQFAPPEPKKKRGRPPKGDTSAKRDDIVTKTLKTEKVKKKTQLSEKMTMMSVEQKKAYDIIASEFSKKLPEYIEKREKEFEQTLETFLIENDRIIEIKQGKVAHIRLSNLLSKPLIFGGVVNTKISAADMAMFSECFWDCVAKASEKILYVPTIEQFCGLMGISVFSFLKYRDNPDENIRETVQMIYDKFCDYYTVKGLTQELNTIMAIFTLKARYGLRDNDAPQMVVNNFSTTVQRDELEELEKKLHFNDKDIIDMEV